MEVVVALIELIGDWESWLQWKTATIPCSLSTCFYFREASTRLKKKGITQLAPVSNYENKTFDKSMNLEQIKE